MILFVAPLRMEMEHFVRGLHDRGHRSTQFTIGRIEARRFPSLDIAVAHGGHGKTQFGVQTQHLLDHAEEAEAVVCIGAAGALYEGLAIGDIVIAIETVEHDYTERFSPHPLPRFAGDAALLSELARLPLGSLPFGAHFGIMASGDEDVIELERGAALRQATEAIAVAWEGAGGARACSFSGIPFIELRGITDTADHNAAAHFDANLHAAMANAAALAEMWRRMNRE